MTVERGGIPTVLPYNAAVLSSPRGIPAYAGMTVERGGNDGRGAANFFPLILNLLKDGNGGGKGRMGRNDYGPSFNKFRMSGKGATGFQDERMAWLRPPSLPSFPRKRESRTVLKRLPVAVRPPPDSRLRGNDGREGRE